jgi:hypothetical protein
MLAQLELTVYGFTDLEGVMHCDAFHDSHTTLIFEALNEYGSVVYFEAEAYHLKEFCDIYGFDYYEGYVEIETVLEKV